MENGKINNTMANINKLLNDYLNYLEIEKNRSIKTCENYERYLKAFFEFGKIKTGNGITPEIVPEFHLLLAKKNIKKNTQSYYVIALRNFLKYMNKRDIEVLSPEKIELPKIPTRQIEIIEYPDLERLLAAPKDLDLRSLRDKAILEMLFSTGLRISELCALNRNFDLKRGELSVRGKGGKLRVVFLSKRAKIAIKNYLEKRGDAEEALFISLTKVKPLPAGRHGLPAGRHGLPAGRQAKIIGRILPRTIQRIVDFYSRKAGIPQKVHPHTIRHLFATDLLIGGADLRSVQELLGHKNIATTQIYTHVTNPHLRDIHKRFHSGGK